MPGEGEFIYIILSGRWSGEDDVGVGLQLSVKTTPSFVFLSLGRAALCQVVVWTPIK